LTVREFVSESIPGMTTAGVPVLKAAGRLDASTVNVLEHALNRSLAKSARVMVIELAEVNYISSSGLRVLLTARRKIRELGGDLVLCALSQNVRDVFDMVGFTALFIVTGSLDQAIQTAAGM